MCVSEYLCVCPIFSLLSLCLIANFNSSVYFLKKEREKEDMKLDDWEGRDDLGGDKGRGINKKVFKLFIFH